MAEGRHLVADELAGSHKQQTTRRFVRAHTHDVFSCPSALMWPPRWGELRKGRRRKRKERKKRKKLRKKGEKRRGKKIAIRNLSMHEVVKVN